MSNKSYPLDCFCEYCGKHFHYLNGLNGHKPYCKLNPNKKHAWNKGLTKEKDERVLKNVIAMKNTKNSDEYKEKHVAWNKGLTKEIDERIKLGAIKQKKTKSDKKWKEDSLNRIYQKYNGRHFTQTKEYWDVCKQNNIKKYGYEHISQVPEIFEKMMNSRYKKKKYEFPSGKIITYQGYEDKALDFLLFLGYKEEDIIINKKQMYPIFYEYNNKKHRYYPDIFIKSKKLFIEVKSSYTMLSNLFINKLKANACIINNFKFEFWLFIGNDLFINGRLNKDYEQMGRD